MTTPTTFSLSPVSDERSSTNGSRDRLDFPLVAASSTNTEGFGVGSIRLVRQFVEEVLTQQDSGSDEGVGSSDRQVDWGAIEASVGGCSTLEQAIGRAIVLADQMLRGEFDRSTLSTTPPKGDDTFFSFSVEDTIPDFGDHSRYRSKVVRRVAGVFKARRAIGVTTVPLAFASLSLSLWLTSSSHGAG
jgi:hypothetical protein